MANSIFFNDIDLKSVQFLDENMGWTVGTAGLYIRTTNAGVTWLSSFLAPNDLESIFLLTKKPAGLGC